MHITAINFWDSSLVATLERGQQLAIDPREPPKPRATQTVGRAPKARETLNARCSAAKMWKGLDVFDEAPLQVVSDVCRLDVSWNPVLRGFANDSTDSVAVRSPGLCPLAQACQSMFGRKSQEL